MSKSFNQHSSAIALFFASILSYGQQNITSDSAYWRVATNSKFPIFTTVSNDRASFKINCFLQSTLLHKLITPETPAPFDALETGSTFFGHEILRNDERVLTVKLNWEGCGAYCENYDQYFSFNSQNGELLTAPDVFTPQGYLQLKSMITHERKELLQRVIAANKKEIEKAGESKTTQADNDDDASTVLKDQIELYEDCLETRDSSYVNSDAFFLRDSSAWFVEDRCLNLCRCSLFL